MTHTITARFNNPGRGTMQAESLTWNDYETLMASRYTRGGMSGAMALHFARGEINAIRTGNHWTHGELTAPDPQAVIIHALTAYELTDGERDEFTEIAAKMEYDGGMDRAAAESRAMAEILHRRYGKAPEVTVPIAGRRAYDNGLEDLRTFAKREWK